MSRDAAERIANYFSDARGADQFEFDSETVARAYLALLAPSEDDERVAEEVVELDKRTMDHPLRTLIAQALTAARARQREADAKIAENGEWTPDGDDPYCGNQIAAAIRGAR